MSWTNLNTDENAGWSNVNTTVPGNFSLLNTASPASRAGVSGVGVSEAAVSGSTDAPPDWTLIET